MKAATDKLSCEHAWYPISIHAAREGGDAFTAAERKTEVISIHAAREGGDPPEVGGRLCLYISIHAAREGGDGRSGATATDPSGFQSTPPVKAATRICR